LIDGRFDEPQIILYSRSLRSFSCPKEPWNRKRGQQGNYADHNHDFDQGEACPSCRLRVLSCWHVCRSDFLKKIAGSMLKNGRSEHEDVNLC
jgi:hypothetical protein